MHRDLLYDAREECERAEEKEKFPRFNVFLRKSNDEHQDPTELASYQQNVKRQRPTQVIEWSTSPEEYIRKAARGDTVKLGGGMTKNEMTIGNVFHREPLHSTGLIFRKPVKVCFWKGLGYSELRRPIDGD